MKKDFKPIQNNNECEKIINGTYQGVLVMCENNEPYAIPMNHAYENGEFYFHCAPHGLKLDFIRKNPRAVYVINKYHGRPEDFQNSKRCHGNWESVVAYGKAKVIEEKKRLKDAFTKFMSYYGEADFRPSENSLINTRAILLKVEKMTARRELENNKTEYFFWKK